MITLTDGTAILTLPPDLMWVDELSWTPVTSSQEFGTEGSQFIDMSVKKAGRPISLKAEDEEHSWILRSTMLSLQTFSAMADKTLTLSIHGAEYSVIFAPGQKPFEAAPIFHHMPMQEEDKYILSAINFITV